MRKVEPIRDTDDIERMKDYLKSKNERDYVMMVTGLYSGMRVSDILPLKVRSVKGTHIEVTERKTGKTKRFAINPALRKKVSNEGLRITHIGRVAAYQILRDAGEHIGLTNIGTHSMRKTFGYHHYRKNQNVGILMELFNHSSPDITLGYIGFKQDELDNSMLNFAY